jgi:hypothetical protein
MFGVPVLKVAAAEKKNVRRYPFLTPWLPGCRPPVGGRVAGNLLDSLTGAVSSFPSPGVVRRIVGEE